MKHSTYFILLTCLLSSCQHSNRISDKETGLPPISMERADSNKDGSLERAEFNQRLDTLFTSRDTNADGGISQSELPTVNLDLYNSADKDNSGDLSKREYIYLRTLDFHRLDTDEDGVLYPHEILRW